LILKIINMTGIELVAQERQEQIEKHGRTVEKDAELNDEEQMRVAALELLKREPKFEHRPFGWDKAIWARMIIKPYKERLIIAGALVAAEIDRLQALENGN
jgi:hypothetical protein